MRGREENEHVDPESVDVLSWFSCLALGRARLPPKRKYHDMGCMGIECLPEPWYSLLSTKQDVLLHVNIGKILDKRSQRAGAHPAR